MLGAKNLAVQNSQKSEIISDDSLPPPENFVSSNCVCNNNRELQIGLPLCGRTIG